MLLDFDKAVDAFAETTVRAHPQGQERAETVQAVGRFLRDVQARMPDYLRLPFRMMTLAFDAWPLARHGRPFHRLPYELRLRQVQAWKASRLEPRRRLVEFYETLAVFSLYSDLYGQDYSHAAKRGTPDGYRGGEEAGG